MIDWMLETAAAVTVLIALVLLVRGPAMRTFGPGIAYALWLLPLGRAVLPEVTMTLEIPAATTVTMEPMAVVAASEATLAPAQTLQVMDWSMALAAVWLTGVVLLSANAALAYARLRRGVAADISLIDVVGRVPIVQSSAVDGPVALGIVRPLVVLPRDFSDLFTPAEQAQVIAHELEHHRGGDLIINLAAFALLAANWFNPIAWLGWRAFRQDQEAACDARTLARTGGDRAIYGRAIAVAAAGHVFRAAPAFALTMGEKSALIHRLRSLTMIDITPRRRWIGRASLIAAALLALPLTASISYAVVQVEAPAAPAALPDQPDGTPAQLPPLPPLPADGNLTAGPGEHVHRIDRDGRTIILRTNQPLSDEEIERLVAEAESGRAIASSRTPDQADEPGGVGRRIERIVIRRHGRSDAVTPVPPVPPVPPVSPVAPVPSVGPVPPVPPAFPASRVDAERQGDRRTVMVRSHAATVRCSEASDGAGPAQPTDDGRRIRMTRCIEVPSTAMRWLAARHARAALVALDHAQFSAEARRSALAELDQVIAELERSSDD